MAGDNDAARGSEPAVERLTELDVRSIDFEAPISGAAAAEARVLGDRFETACKAARSEGNDLAFRVFQLLAGLCSFHFKPEDPAEPFGPMWVIDDRRTPIPEDYREDCPLLRALMRDIKSPVLRARVADTVWVVHRAWRDAADVAVDAYRETAERLLRGELRSRRVRADGLSLELTDVLRRMLQISRIVEKRGQRIPEVLEKVALDCLSAAERIEDLRAWQRITQTLLRFGLGDARALAATSEALTAKATDPFQVKELWELAASCLDRAEEVDGATRCRLAAAEQMVAIARSMGPALASATWLMDAIEALRRLPGTRARREELEVELREAQQASLEDMGAFSHEVDLTELVNTTLSEYEDQPLSVAMAMLAEVPTPKPVAHLRDEARKALERSPVSAIIDATHVDREGKVISKKPGASLKGEADEEWYKHEIAQYEGLSRQIAVVGQIEPVRLTLNKRFAISIRTTSALVSRSPFVPPDHRETFALGLARLFEGDFISAVHLLVPQMENALRHVLRSSGLKPSMIQSDLIQEDRSISALLTEHRTDLERIFSEDAVFQIDLLFNDRAGPALRHELAHGKLTDAACNSSDAVFACWLIYRLTCLPLFGRWLEIMSPAVDGT